MIQFNLLPDVKQEYIKAARTKRTVIVLSVIIAGACLFIFVLLFMSVNVFQKQRIKGYNESIKTNTTKLKQTKDLDKVLTIQNQLNTLSDLHDKKPVVTRLSGFLTQVTPNDTTIAKLDLDFDTGILTVGGTGTSLAAINKFVDTLKFTKFGETGDDGKVKLSEDKPFTEVVLTSFSNDSKEPTYQIVLKFNPAIFDVKKKIVLEVPKITSTRSDVEKPTELFKALPEVKVIQ